jgi:ATP-dependent Clp protease adaptor protein ClpS
MMHHQPGRHPQPPSGNPRDRHIHTIRARPAHRARNQPPASHRFILSFGQADVRAIISERPETLMPEDTTQTQDQKDQGGGTAVIDKPKTQAKPKSTDKPKGPQQLPPWKVLLHNDDLNSRDYVVDTIVELTTLNEQDATLRMDEADKTGVALLLTTHKERAELYRDQFRSKKLIVTIEPAE